MKKTMMMMKEVIENELLASDVRKKAKKVNKKE